MDPLIQLKRTTSVFLVAFGLACFAFSSAVRAVLPSPTPDGGYPNGNTAEGQNALFSLTTGRSNTAVGFASLYGNTTKSFNTAIGNGALFANTADNNTAIGASALLNNTTGTYNTATGVGALQSNTKGSYNTANGFQALYHMVGVNNTVLACYNTATGIQALFTNTTGHDNTATGRQALYLNTTGSENTATGDQALGANTSGSKNVALGFAAGVNLTTGNNNIDIGNFGVAGDANTIRIGGDTGYGSQTATYIAGIHGATVGSGVGVIIGSNGHLGTVVSSERFKDRIKPMDKASEAILTFKPVTFCYKHELDPDGIPQFGLLAEEVEKVNPALITRDADGKPYSVRYDAVNAMLLNEFLKEHRKMEALQAGFAQQQKKFQAIVARQQKQIDLLTAGLQKVSAQLEASKPAPQVVNNP